MSTGMRKWMEKGCPDIPTTPAEVSIGRELLKQLLDELVQYKNERDDLRAKIAEMEKQEPAGYGVRYVEPTNGEEDWDSIWMHRVFAEDHIKDFTQAYADVGEPVGAIAVVPLYALPGAQPAPSFADAYQGAMGEVAIWKKRALEAEDLNRKFVAEINGPTHMGEPVQNEPSVPEDVMRDAERYRYLRARDEGTAGVGCWLEAKGRVCYRGWLYGDQLDSAIDCFIEVLAAAPEAKP